MRSYDCLSIILFLSSLVTPAMGNGLPWSDTLALPDSLWFWIYKAPWGWVWTSRSYFPFFYHAETGSWMYCLLPSVPSRASWWYNYTTGEWTALP